jgi:predicted hotdog family 3-hydroxylacyl-ACP dehydratase
MILQQDVPYRIDEIVPHSSRMSLLDELVRYNRDQIVVAVNISERSQFFEASLGVPAYVGIEYMAQAVAAFAGIEEVQRGRRPKIGLLLGSRRYTCSVAYFAPESRLEIVANMRFRDESNLVGLVCEINSGGALIASADLKAVLPDDVRATIDSQS